jgi:methionyl-tRNA synthetase
VFNRFFFMREVAFGADGDFNEERFRDTVNAGLANSLGNLVNRSLNLLKKNCDGRAPADASDVPASHPLRVAVDAAVPAVAAAYEDLAFHEAIQSAMGVCVRCAHVSSPLLAAPLISSRHACDCIILPGAC